MITSNGVEIPPDILQAQREGTLVIFAGAGVSVPPPSRLPIFKDLAKKIGEGTRPFRESEIIDQYLGKLKLNGIDVHAKAKKELTITKPRPNQLHFNLLQLFQSQEEVRLITTNFDKLFSKATRELHWEVDEYTGPALPLGRDFLGIINLHGSIEKCNKMVLTDLDFANAYVQDEWAKNFLKPMLTNYLVVFVGYSHDDPIMHYLTRSAVVHKYKRYIFVKEEARPYNDERNEKWNLLEIQPIFYPHAATDNAHEQLIIAISDWAKLASGGVIEFEPYLSEDVLSYAKSLKYIVIGPPTDDPKENRIVEEVFTESDNDHSKLQLFAKHCNRIEWFRWLEKRQDLYDLRLLFNPNAELNIVGRWLAWWFSEKFCVEFENDAQLIIQEYKGTLNSFTALKIGQQLWQTKATLTDKQLLRWLLLLQHSLRSDQFNEILDMLTHNLDAENQPQSLLFVFEELTKISLDLTRQIDLDSVDFSENGISRKHPSKDIISAEISGHSDHDWYTLKELWEKKLSSRLDKFGDVLLSFLPNRIYEAQRILDAYSQGNYGSDAFSHHIPTIENEGQWFKYHNAFDTFIRMNRELLEWALIDRPEKAKAIIRDWKSSRIIVLHRLALHGVRVSSWKPEQKIEWLISSKLLYSTKVEHEVSRLIKEIAPKVSDKTKHALIRAIQQGPEWKRGHTKYEWVLQLRLDRLYWFLLGDSEFEPLKRVFKEIQNQIPDYRPINDPADPTRYGLNAPKPSLQITDAEILAMDESKFLNFYLSYLEKDEDEHS